jgi:dienelactone hydrolase
MAARHFIPFMLSTRVPTVEPRIMSFFTRLRESTPSLPIGVADYCWGGKYATGLSHSKPERPKPLVGVVYTAHPSNLSIPADIIAIQKPTSIAVGTRDMVIPLKQVEEVKGLLTKKSDVPNEIITYEDTRHGFAARADFKDEKQLEQANDAETQAVNWYTRFFAEWKPT